MTLTSESCIIRVQLSLSASLGTTSPWHSTVIPKPECIVVPLTLIEATPVGLKVLQNIQQNKNYMSTLK